MVKFKTYFISIGSLLSSLLGILYIPVLLMVVCNIFDYISGILASLYSGEKISSEIGLKGIIKKVSMWLLVVVGVITDSLISYATEAVGFTFPLQFLVASIVCIWIVCNELISMCENIKRSGVKVPAFMNKILYYVKDRTEQTGDISVGGDEENAEG